MPRRSVELAPEGRARLLEAIRAGSDRATAAAYVRLSVEDLEELLAGDAELSTALEAAEAAVAVAASASVMKAARDGNVAAAGMLLRREGRPKCGATNKQNGASCRHPRGFRTTHVGFGRCFLHGGNTPNGIRSAERARAEASIAKLGIPRGNGDPFALLAAAVSHAHGHLEATSSVVQEAAAATGDSPVALEVALELYDEAIRNAARTGKQAVDADVADRLAALDERGAGLLMRFVAELLDRVVPKARRPELEAWASTRLGELAAEYDRPGAVH